MDDDPNTYYLFEYDRPGKKTPGKTRHRMTIAMAKERHGDGYRPILASKEIRDGKVSAQFYNFEPYAPGTGPVHIGKPKRHPPDLPETLGPEIIAVDVTDKATGETTALYRKP